MWTQFHPIPRPDPTVSMHFTQHASALWRWGGRADKKWLSDSTSVGSSLPSVFSTGPRRQHCYLVTQSDVGVISSGFTCFWTQPLTHGVVFSPPFPLCKIKQSWHNWFLYFHQHWECKRTRRWLFLNLLQTAAFFQARAFSSLFAYINFFPLEETRALRLFQVGSSMEMVGYTHMNTHT